MLILTPLYSIQIGLFTLEATCSSLINFQDRQASGASWLGSRLLLFYLRLRIKELVKKYYPTVSTLLLWDFLNL